MDELKSEFYPIKAKAERTAQLMNETGINQIVFDLETKPKNNDGEFKKNEQVYKCMIWKAKD